MKVHVQLHGSMMRPFDIVWGMQALYMLGDITAGPAFRFTQWLQLVRKRTANYRSSGFPHRTSTTMPSTSWLVTTTCYL